MSMILNEINKLAFVVAPVFYKLLTMSLAAACIGLVILLIRALADKKITPVWKYAMWSLVLIALLVPYRPQSKTAVLPTPPVEEFSYREEYDAIAQEVFISRQDENIDPVVFETMEQEKDTLYLKSLVVDVLLPLGWLGGTAAFSAVFVLSAWNLSRKIKASSKPADSRCLAILEECKLLLAMNQDIKLIVQSHVTSPAINGCFRGKILLPDYIDEMEEEQLRFILLHELSHLKRKDTLVNGLLIVLQCIYWFNPILWLLFRFLREDMELLNDSYVLNRIGAQQGKAYSLALVEVLARSSRLPLTPKLLCMCDEGKNLQRRISMIKMAETFKKKKIIISVVCILLIVGMSLLFLTQSNGESFENNPTISAASTRDLSNWNIGHVEEVVSSMDYGDWLSYSAVELKLLNTDESPTIEVKLKSSKDVLENTNALFAEMEESLKEKGAVLMNLFDTPRVAFRCTYGDSFHYEWVREDSLSPLDKQSVKTLADHYRQKLSGTFSDIDAAAAVKALTFPSENGISLTGMEFKGYSLELNFTSDNMDGNGWKAYLSQTEVQENLASLTQVLNLSWVSMNYDNDTSSMNYFIQRFEIDSAHYNNSGDKMEVIKAAIERENISDSADYTGGTTWSAVTKEDYLSAMNSPEIEAWLKTCTNEDKAYALRHELEFKGLKRVEWLLYFPKHSGSEYNTGVDYGWFNNTVKVDFHPVTEDSGNWLMRIHHTDDGSYHKGKLKVFYNGKFVDCEITEVNYSLAYLDKLPENVKESESSPAVTQLHFPAGDIYSDEEPLFSKPFVASMKLPEGWSVREGESLVEDYENHSQWNKQLPSGGTGFASAYLYAEGREDAIGWMFVNSFDPNQYEEPTFPNEQYYQTVFPDLRLSSYRIWDPFTSVKLTDSGEIGTCDIWFHDIEYIAAHPNENLSSIPSMEALGIWAYDVDLKAYLCIGFAADSGLTEEQCIEIAESLVLEEDQSVPQPEIKPEHPLTEEELFREQRKSNRYLFRTDETKVLDIARKGVERYFEYHMGENVPEYYRIKSYKINDMELFAYSGNEFAVSVISEYGCMDLGHLSANGNFAPDGDDWYCTDDYREFRFEIVGDGEYIINGIGTGGYGAGLTLIERNNDANYKLEQLQKMAVDEKMSRLTLENYPDATAESIKNMKVWLYDLSLLQRWLILSDEETVYSMIMANYWSEEQKASTMGELLIRERTTLLNHVNSAIEAFRQGKSFDGRDYPQEFSPASQLKTVQNIPELRIAWGTWDYTTGKAKVHVYVPFTETEIMRISVLSVEQKADGSIKVDFDPPFFIYTPYDGYSDLPSWIIGTQDYVRVTDGAKEMAGGQP